MAPDSRGPLRFLRSLLRTRPLLVVLAPITGSLWLLPTAVLPLVLGRALDAGPHEELIAAGGSYAELHRAAAG